MKDVLPIPDSAGKILNATHEYFDFSVNARSTLADVSYQVIVLKQPQSTLAEEYAKVYVTTKNANVEVASPLVEKDGVVLTYKELPDAAVEGKIVYNGLVPKSEKDYHQEFRLRMWIRDGIEIYGEDGSVSFTNISNRVFSVKVRVIATEI